MKKYFIYLAAALVALSSCNKEDKVPDVPKTDPIDKTDPVDKSKVFINVTPSDAIVKTSFDASAKKIAWENSDKISIFTAAEGETEAQNNEFTIGEDVTNPVFSGTLAAEGTYDLYALYPYSADAGTDMTKCKVVIPGTQNPSQTSWEGKADVMVGSLKSQTLSLGQNAVTMPFGHLFGFVRMSFDAPAYASEKVESVKIESTKAIAGDFTVNMSDCTVATTADSLKSITLSYDGTVELADFVAWAVLNPGTYDVAITITTTSSVLYFERSGLVVERQSISSPEVKMSNSTAKDFAAHKGIVSVSPAGSGNKTGADADNALPFESFCNIVAGIRNNSEDPFVSIRREARRSFIAGTTFKLAAGEYLVSSEAGQEKNLGMYLAFNSSVRTEFTVEGTRTASDSTVFAPAVTDSRIFNIGSLASPTFKNICFRNGSFTGANGGAIFLGGSADAPAEASFENCSFIDNHCTTGTTNGGGSIAVGVGTLNLSACYFGVKDNTTYLARNGGALYTNNTAAVINANNCVFKGLYSYNTGGVANNSGGTQNYTDCLFSGTKTYDGTGGAIHANKEDGVCNVNLTRCTFKACEAFSHYPCGTDSGGKAAGGAISMQHATIVVGDCVFDSCLGQRGGVILLQAGNGLLKANNCVFKNNQCASRGIVQINKGAVAFFNNCAFYDNVFNTGGWSSVIHGGGTAASCFNNCTFGPHIYKAKNSNSATVNNDGYMIVTNSTIINTDVTGVIRNNHGTAETSCVLAGIIAINTTPEKALIAANKGYVNSYNCLFGAANSLGVWTSSNDKTGVAETSLGGSWSAGKFSWAGPDESFAKLDAATFEAAVKSLDANNGNTVLNSAIGAGFYAWLVEIGAIGYDAYGTNRGAAWWPGAYQN